MRCAILSASIGLSLGFLGCSVWIDDFEVGTANEIESQGSDATDSANTDPSGTDSEIPDPGNCGLMFAVPGGGTAELCVVDVGTFQMGCDPKAAGETCGLGEQPAHPVQLTRFQVTRQEISREQYAAFLTANPQWRKAGSATSQCDTRYLADWVSDSPPGGSEQLPVIQICWYAAQAFCQWLGPGFDLPTEAQWEAAARGTHDGKKAAYWIYAFGNQASCELANYESCGRAPKTTSAAGGTSSLGVRGLAGNAWEWVRDWHRRDYYCDPDGLGANIEPNCDTTHAWTDPQGDAAGAVKALRGGSFGHEATNMRSAARASLSPDVSSDFSGLRCARLAP